nr:MAG TPA: hypothetical protein [Caudoviricetes sp.]
MHSPSGDKAGGTVHAMPFNINFCCSIFLVLRYICKKRLLCVKIKIYSRYSEIIT